MPDFGKTFTWLIENGGIMMTWIIVVAIVLFTLWVKRDEWFGKRTSAPKPPAPKAEEPEPKKVPEPEPAKTVKVEPVTVPKKDDKSLENFRLGLWRMFGAGIAMIIIVLLAKNLNKAKNDYIFDGPVARPQVAGASPYFKGQTHFLQEVIRFWNEDPEIVATSTRRERWEGIDTVRFESRYQQFNPDGTVFRGVQNPRDIGMFQINLDESAKEIAEAQCNVEAVDCQFKVARLIWKHSKFKRWKAHKNVLKASVYVKKVVAPVGEWGETFRPPFNDTCFWEVDREVEMMGEDGQKYKFLPDFVPYFATKTTTYQVPDEPAGLVTISCRQEK